MSKDYHQLLIAAIKEQDADLIYNLFKEWEKLEEQDENINFYSFMLAIQESELLSFSQTAYFFSLLLFSKTRNKQMTKDYYQLIINAIKNTDGNLIYELLKAHKKEIDDPSVLNTLEHSDLLTTAEKSFWLGTILSGAMDKMDKKLDLHKAAIEALIDQVELLKKERAIVH